MCPKVLDSDALAQRERGFLGLYAIDLKMLSTILESCLLMNRLLFQEAV